MKNKWLAFVCWMLFFTLSVFAEQSTTEWNFNTAGDTEGWSIASSAVNVGRVSQSNGTWKYTTSSGGYSWMDNYITKKISFSADQYMHVELVMKHAFKEDPKVDLEAYGYAVLYYSGVTAAGKSFVCDEQHRVSVKLEQSSNGSFLTHDFDMTNARDWKGSTITSLMFKPLFDDGSWEIDRIRLISNETANENNIVWSFNTAGDAEGWSIASAAVNAGRVSQSNGTWKYTTSSSGYSWMDNYITHTTDFSADLYKGVELVMKHTFKNDPKVDLNAYGYAALYYSGVTATGTSFSRDERHRVNVKLEQSSNGAFLTHYFDMTGARDWQGSTITSLMFKPLFDDGSWEIDEIRVIAKPESAIPGLDVTKLTLRYAFEDNKPGMADGTISIDFGGESSTYATKVLLRWATVKDGSYVYMPDHLALKEATGAEMEKGVTFDKDLLIPQGATALVAYIVNGTRTLKLAYDIPQSKQTPDRGKPLYTAAFISDIHIGGWGSETTPNARLLAAREQVNDLADFVVVNGDLTQWYGAYSGEAFKNYHVSGTYADNGSTSTDPSKLLAGTSQWKVTEDYFKGFTVPVYAVQGNHDVRDSEKWNPICCGDTYWTQFLKDWIAYSNTTTGSQKYINTVKRDESVSYYDTEISGHHYIFLEIPRNTAPHYAYGTEQLAWLDKVLYEKEATGKPIFVFGHVPVESEVSGGYWDEQLLASGADAAIKKILANHPTAIYVSGHTHYSLDINFKSSIDGAQRTPSYVNAGGVATVQTPNSENAKAEDSTELSSSSQGVIAEVYEDCVVLRGRDFVNGKWIARGQTILTFQTGNTLSPITVVQTGVGDTVTLTASGKEGLTYAWYLNGEKQKETGAVLAVSADFDGYIAVRATDEQGHYTSESYETLKEIQKLPQLEVASLTFADANGQKTDIFENGSMTATIRLSAAPGVESGYVLLVAYGADERIDYSKLAPLKRTEREYTLDVTGSSALHRVRVFVLDPALAPLAKACALVSEN